MRGSRPATCPTCPTRRRRGGRSDSLLRSAGLLLALAVTACGGGQTGAGSEPTPSPALAVATMGGPPGEPIVFLVRHAERATDDPRDPTLTPEGTERADLLATLLAQAGITAIYSTDLRRTRRTAAPLAAATGLPLRIYNPGDSASMVSFAREVLADGGRVLVVGHSNTVGPTVARLGGDPGSPIAEDEYDRLYVLVPGATGSGKTVLLRYGRPWPG